MNKLVSVLLCCIVGITVCLVCCFFYKKSEDESNNPIILVEQQTQQMKTWFQKNKVLLIELQKLSETVDLDNASIKEDGYFVLHDERAIWIDNISEQAKALFTTKDVDFNLNSVYYVTENDRPTPRLEIEVYYPENQMMYTIVYCKLELATQDDRYLFLDDNWYLWVTGMT